MSNDQKDRVIEAARLVVESFYNDDLVGENMHYLKEEIEAFDKPELITMDGEYTYRNGEPARVLCVDSPDANYPVVVIDGEGKISTHTIKGSHSSGYDEKANQYDLIPAQKKPAECWMTTSDFNYWLFEDYPTPPFKSAKLVREVLEDE